MTGRELISELINNPDINLDQEVALATKDGAFENMEQAMFHIKKIAPKDNCVTILWFDDIRHQGAKTPSTYNKIKAIIDGWAVDDDEHELLNQIADIIDEEAENDNRNT